MNANTKQRRPSTSASAIRGRKSRRCHVDTNGFDFVNQFNTYTTIEWTAHDLESLILHLEFFGCRWKLIAKSMVRSPDSLRNKILRIFGETNLTRMMGYKRLKDADDLFHCASPRSIITEPWLNVKDEGHGGASSGADFKLGLLGKRPRDKGHGECIECNQDLPWFEYLVDELPITEHEFHIRF